MKKGIIVITLLVGLFSYSQIGIGTATPNASAALDVTSTTRGLLPPRMTYAQKNTIASPVAGLILWCTNCSSNGEMQVYNGTTWTTTYGGTASLATPDPPIMGTAVAGNTTATVNFTAPLSNGGSDIISYTVTASPEGITALGTGSPITVFGLTNGTAYTFTVVATNAVGNSVASAPVQTRTCGAYVAAGVWKQFMCHNLGADTSFDPNNPVKQINGSYYQWGRNAPAAIVTTSQDAIVGTWGSQGDTSASGNWTSTGTGGPNDPCPTGFRVPSKVEWDNVVSLNTVSFIGSWTSNPNNFSSALCYGTSAGIITLTLPSAGYRNYTNGALSLRNNNGEYWSSTEGSGNAYTLDIYYGSVSTNFGSIAYGCSVRCITE